MTRSLKHSITSAYFTGSLIRREYCEGKSSIIDIIVFTSIKPPGYPWLLVAPYVRAIVFPNPELTGNLLPNIVTALPSKLTTTRVSLEKKILIYGNDIKLKTYEEYNEDDIRHYLLYLWTMYLTAKRIHDPRSSCKLLYEVLWFITTISKGPIEYSWINIALGHKTRCNEDIVKYCLEVLLCRHECRQPVKIANYAYSLINQVSMDLFNRGIDELSWDIGYFTRTAPRFREANRG